MKKLASIVAILLVLVLGLSFVGCGSAKAEIVFESDTLIVFRVNEEMGAATVFNAMMYLRGRGELDFKSLEGSWGKYVTEINGVAEVTGATSGKSWMLYSNDPENSSLEFGSLTFEGHALGQTAYGISSQPVKAGYLYALRLEDWSF